MTPDQSKLMNELAKGQPGSIRGPHEQDLFCMGYTAALEDQAKEIERLKGLVEKADDLLHEVSWLYEIKTPHLGEWLQAKKDAGIK